MFSMQEFHQVAAVLHRLFLSLYLSGFVLVSIYLSLSMTVKSPPSLSLSFALITQDAPRAAVSERTLAVHAA